MPWIAPLVAVERVGTPGCYIARPFLVFLVQRLDGIAVVYGGLSAKYSSFQLFDRTVLARMSDRIGRRLVLLLSRAGALMS